MRENYLLGMMWILLAGISQGGFALPMKYVRRWKWEHLWLVYSCAAFIIIPLLFAVFTVPLLSQVYAQTSGSVILLTIVFGAAWGIGSIFFGLGIDALGLALGFSIMTGMYTALGALIPLAILTPELILTRNGLLIIAGNIVTIVGVVVCAFAGDLRDKLVGSNAQTTTLNKQISFGKGMAICIASGILSAAFNFSYAFGKPIAETAERYGATSQNSLNAIWLVALPAGGVLNIAYCVYLLSKRKSWPLLWRQTAPSDWLGALLMAVLWSVSVVIYGWGANYLGKLGPSLGWSLWNAFMIITTVLCGLLTREWAGARGRPLNLLFIGIGVLIFGAVLLGLGGAGG